MVFETKQRICPMARKAGIKSTKRIKYFYIDGCLCRVLNVSRPQDLAMVWNYPEKKRQVMVWSDIQRRMERAFTITEVGVLLNRHRHRVADYMFNTGAIRKPQRIYSLATGKPGAYMFSESDVLEVHTHFVNLHRGRPRKDGFIKPKAMPTREELRAMMRYDTMLYVKDDEGQLIPIYKEQNW